MVGEDAKHLFFQRIFWDSIVIVKPRLSAPANVEGRIHIRFAPLHNCAELLPIINLFKSEMFHWRAGDNHAVEFFLPHVAKGLIKFEHMFC